MKTILITFDSLNRHFLSLYGADEVDTPNLDCIAKEGIIFDSHFTASAPCIPARRELLKGILELRHRSWGPLEPFDTTLPKLLDNISCPSMLVTNHYHYFRPGGENYHHDFTGYELIRGHENDNWKTHDVKEPEFNIHSRTYKPHERAQGTFMGKDDYPIAKTFKKAEEWVEENLATDDFFLYIDEFDPHEPFMVPGQYLEKYDDSGYSGPRLDWPEYGKWKGNDVELAHIRNRYRAKIKFADDMLGAFIGKLKENDLYDDTTIIITTDHGHYLGEHGIIGKPDSDNYNTLYNIPLIIKPARSLDIERGRRLDCLSSTPDIFATICDINKIDVPEGIYGKSLLPALKGTKDKIRDYVLYGYYGRQLGYCDGDYTYLKTPVDFGPLYYYSTRISTIRYLQEGLLNQYKNTEDISIGKFIEGVDFPVQRFKLEQSVFPFEFKNLSPDTLYNFKTDKTQDKPIRDEDKLDRYKAKLKKAMEVEGFPTEQLERLDV